MLMLFSTAWWAQKLAGPVLQAFGAALAVAVVAGSLGLGLVWLRADAREDGRAEGVVERDSLRAEVALLKAAAVRAATTLRLRAEAKAAGEARIAEMEAEMEELRNASPDRDKLVVPPGDPWLERRPRPAGRLPKRP
jgi:hypothetical protein